MRVEQSIPTQSEAVDITNADHVFSFNVDAIFIGTAGTLVAKLKGDTAARTWKNVPAGTSLSGDWERVVKAGTAAADMVGTRSWRDR